MRRIVGFVGFQGSGKNTAAAALYPYGFVPLSFADALKDMLAAVFCWDRQMLEGITKESREWREQVDPWWAEKLGIAHFTPRWAMRNTGTEVMRRHLHEEIWVFNVERRMMLTNSDVVLVDGRFPNEIGLAHRHGGKVYRIQRGDDPWWTFAAESLSKGQREYRWILNAAAVHESEYAWVGHPIDGTISNDGGVDDLHAQVIRRVIGC